MAWRIVQQPNGSFARFSEVVDNFTHSNMTRDEAVTLCREYLGREDAERKVENAIKEPARYEEALSIILTIHGRDEAEKVMQELY